MTAQQCAERQAARDNLVRELCEALEDILSQFTKTPLTLKDTEARVRAYAVLRRAKEQQ